jgi:hypothetical protein
VEKAQTNKKKALKGGASKQLDEGTFEKGA